MSNRNDNDFDFDSDDLFGSDDDGGFGQDDDFPSALGDADESDMPDIQAERERGTNPAFIILAILMILLFVGGLGVVLFLATRETGPSDGELTATSVVMLNMTVAAQLAQTQTQSAFNNAQTRT
ncbi:MAG: hypothetical protein SGI73_08305, partial [Chloroflexota bacterium]|nr:hypothetical protein [Chloroflexota bacterium]